MKTRLSEGLARLASLRLFVQSEGACALDCVSLRADMILPELQAALADGMVEENVARIIDDGLRFGFRGGVDVTSPLLRGQRRFRNYPSSLEHRAQVSKGLRARVVAGKTLLLGPYEHARDRHLLPKDFRIFPMGAVEKPLEPDEWRSTSDHTRSGLNPASELSALRHSITVYRDIELYHHAGAVMRVSDVEGAFPLLPWHPDVWPFLLFEWWDVHADDTDESAEWCLYVHLCGDFGGAGMPGCWHMFFEQGMVRMARHQGVLRSPMAVCVDDTALIGRAGTEAATNAEGAAFTAWLARRGVFSKVLKDKAAASLQFCVGFWWDSVTHTRTLEERRLAAYVAMLSDFARRRSLSLSEMQRISGRMQRAIKTLPPGAACLLANLFALMRGLSLPWQKRRSSAALRSDFATVAELLELNEGKGFYRFDNFVRVPHVETDASRSGAYSGGGYFSFCGRYRWFPYGTRASRRPIDYLEGDVVVLALEDLGGRWRDCIVLFRVDNRSFQGSAVKGWSRAERLSLLLRRLFRLSVSHGCILEFEWLSSEENMFADALSRQEGERRFLELVRRHEPLPPQMPLIRHPSSGIIRRFGREFSSDEDGDGPGGEAVGGAAWMWALLMVCLLAVGPVSAVRGGAHARGGGVAATVSYARTSVYTGLPEALAAQVDGLLDNRLAPSSMRSISAALSHWDVVRGRHGWPRVIRTDLPARGGRLMAFLLYLIYETELVADSISNYVWAFRSWNKLQRQLDPVFGIAEWDDIMMSMAVVAWKASEPRRQVPLELVFESLRHVDCGVFWEVQAAVLMLVLLYTFARSESPCPASYVGEGSLDPNKHLLVRDVDVVAAPRLHARVRLKAIKQDPRLERASARAGEDWVDVGAVEAQPEACLLVWLRRLFALHAQRRAGDQPFFVARDRLRAYRYADALADVRALWARVCGVAVAAGFGLHGLRVAGYNGTRRRNRELAVAQGGWDPVAGANDRYDRFTRDEVLDIPAGIVASTGDVAQPDVAPDVQEQALGGGMVLSEPLERQIVRRRPADGGGRLGSARRGGGGEPSSSALVSASQVLPRRRQRVRVFWTGEGAWFSGVLTSHRRGGQGLQESRVLYDATERWPRREAFWHDLGQERWELLPHTVQAAPSPPLLLSVSDPAAQSVPPDGPSPPIVTPLRSGRLSRPADRLPAALQGGWSSAAH